MKEVLKELNNKLDIIISKLDNLGVKQPYNKMDIPFGLSNDKFIYIDSNRLEEISETKMLKQAEVSDSEKILVHSTSLFPVENKILTGLEGHKIDGYTEIEYKGFNRLLPSYSGRNTVHFIQNNVVSNHMYGQFSNNYIILEPMKYHLDQMASDSANDSWTRGSINLSSDAIILVKEDCIENIPSEIQKKYNIILYNNDREKCVKNLLYYLGYPVIKMDLGSAEHAYSLDMVLENCIKSRNLMISFFKDEDINSKDIILDKESVATLYDFYKNVRQYFTTEINTSRINLMYNKLIKTFCQNNNIEFELFIMFINFGLIKKGENYVSIFYDKMCELQEMVKSETFEERTFKILVDELGISEIQEAINNKDTDIKNNYGEKTDFIDKRFDDINNFKNIEYASEFQKNINELFEKEGYEVRTAFDKDGIQVKYSYIENEKYNNEKIYFKCENCTCREVLEQIVSYIQSLSKSHVKNI